MYKSPFASSPGVLVAGDPLRVQHYLLPNGLRVFISVNKEEPRVFTNIAFRVGSKYDPADTTGLAHYMEHMLFKGTSRIGALDWERESALLEQIADLYEVYRRTTEDEERRRLYGEIDRLSYEAAHYVAPNEYDRLTTALGAKSTNAYTWLEQTVYVNDLPSNELERWLRLESERFRHLALRLFHTELETVYEEFNISQDKDFRRVHQALREMLYSNHPYGTQTTLGAPEHLKNPSMRAIEHFFRTYYVPNNMAIILAGDLDADQAVKWIEQYFGSLEPVEFAPFEAPGAAGWTGVQRREVTGREAAYLELAWPLGPGQTEEAMLGVLVQNILHNHQAGLLDINLNQQQRVLEADAWMWLYEDHSAFGLYGKPREGQSLEDVEALLLDEIRRLQAGDFPDWLVQAVVRDMKRSDLQAMERNQVRVNAITNCFILGITWEQYTRRYEWFERHTKEDVIAFARRHLPLDRFAVVYKQQGEHVDSIKVDKPAITPVPMKREAVSAFAQSFLREPVRPIKPEFIDFDAAIRQDLLRPDVPLAYVRNPHNPLFRLDYIFEMGKLHSLDLALAFIYQPYLGTSRYSSVELQREFFRLGLSFDVYTYDKRCYITLTGLEESLEPGLRLLEHFLADVQTDAAAWRNVVEDILIKRGNIKRDRQVVLQEALLSYARYGAESPFSYRVPADDLRQIDPERLTNVIRELTSYQHRIYYYGQIEPARVCRLLKRYHQLPDELRLPPPPRAFPQLPTAHNQVLFVDFPIVQTDLMLVSRGTPHFHLEEYLLSDWYNEYFGTGLSSVVFQEIREAKALAYSTYAAYSTPSLRDGAHYLQAYLGTQPDKVTLALPTLLDLLEYMPRAEENMEQARQSILRRIETDRIPASRLYWEAQGARDRGYNRDLLADIYRKLQAATPAELTGFHQEFVRGRFYNVLVLGNRKEVPLDFLARFAPVRELTLEELFGY